MGDFFWNYGLRYAGPKHAVFFLYMPINAIEPLSVGYTYSVFCTALPRHSRIDDAQWLQN